MAGDLGAQVPFELQHTPHRFVLALCQGCIQVFPFAQHGLFHLLSNHRTDFAQVFTDLFHFLDCTEEELQVSVEIPASPWWSKWAFAAW